MKVAVGMPVDNPIPHRTTVALAHTAYNCGIMGVNFSIFMEVSGIVDVARDGVLDTFLESDCEKLFWIDSDIVWSKEQFFRLLALSTRVDVVGATYPFKKDTPEQVFCVNMDAGAKSEQFGLIPINGMGLGFTIMDRKVVEKIAATKPRFTNHLNGREMAKVFRVDIVDGSLRTEDMAFFHDIREAGYTVWLDPTIDLGHIGEKEWQGTFSSILKRTE